MSNERTRRPSSGAGQDRRRDSNDGTIRNGVLVDPTVNVKEGLAAAVGRLDDLHDALKGLVDAKIGALNEIVKLRADHAKEIRESESKRIDAVRQIDVLAVRTEAERALAAIQTLAVTTASNAENLRVALQNTANTIATQTKGIVDAITERIAALEKSSYTGAGKEAVSDPALSTLARAVEQLREQSTQRQGRDTAMDPALQLLMKEVAELKTARAQRSGGGQALSGAWAVLLGVFSLIAMLLGIASFFKPAVANVVAPTSNGAPAR